MRPCCRKGSDEQHWAVLGMLQFVLQQPVIFEVFYQNVFPPAFQNPFKILFFRKVLDDLVRLSIWKLPFLKNIAMAVRRGNRRTAALHKVVVGKNEAAAGLQQTVEMIEPLLQGLQRDMRPDKAAKQGVVVPSWL
jgi:hypothetical protein